MRKGGAHSPYVLYKLVFGWRWGWDGVLIMSTASENSGTNDRKNSVGKMMMMAGLGED